MHCHCFLGKYQKNVSKGCFQKIFNIKIYCKNQSFDSKIKNFFAHSVDNKSVGPLHLFIAGAETVTAGDFFISQDFYLYSHNRRKFYKPREGLTNRRFKTTNILQELIAFVRADGICQC